MFNQATINQIRSGSVTTELLHLMTIFNDDNAIIHRFASADNSVLVNEVLFQGFPFMITLPKSTISNLSQVSITIPNFSVNNIDIRNVLTTSRIRVGFIDRSFPDAPLVPDRILFPVGYSRQIATIDFQFTPSYITDKRFPFSRYNSTDHPSLYPDS